MNFYGKYKGIRDASWQTLLDFDVRELPVKVISIAKQAGIRIIGNSKANELNDRQLGVCILDEDQWYIIVDDSMTDVRIRFTIAHELGHIFLGHELKLGYRARQFENQRSDEERAAEKSHCLLNVNPLVLI